MPAA
ncbi:hypothetical protein EYF80_058178 [Liparis tanakae]|jgi:hypothetical protein